MNGSGDGAKSLATKFRAGDGLEGHLGRWLLLQVAGGDVEAEGKSGHEPPDPASSAPSRSRKKSG